MEYFIEIDQNSFIRPDEIEGIESVDGITKVYTHHHIYQSTLPLTSLLTIIELKLMQNDFNKTDKNVNSEGVKQLDLTKQFVSL
jgi:hypothetical protein